jgi:glucarate dehydratase
LRIVGGAIEVPLQAGMGVECDMFQIEEAHRLYQRVASGARNDAAAMQFLIPGWRFDPKRPALIR